MAEQRAAQEPARRDPFELWRQLYEANEQAWNKAIKEMTTTPDYAEAQGKLLEILLAYQKFIRDGITTQLTTLNVPTRDDISRLGELIVALEEKVDRLEETISRQDEAVGRVAQQMARMERHLARQTEEEPSARSQEAAESAMERPRRAAGRGGRQTGATEGAAG